MSDYYEMSDDVAPLFQKMSDCETDCAALNLSSCTLVDHTLADPHLLLLSKVEVDTEGCFNEAAYLAQVVMQHSPSCLCLYLCLLLVYIFVFVIILWLARSCLLINVSRPTNL